MSLLLKQRQKALGEKMRITKSKIKFVSKSWGFEKWLENNELYCGKLLFFVKDLSCSAHYHRVKTETFYLHSGKVEVRFSDDIKKLEEHLSVFGVEGIFDHMEKEILEPGDTFFVPPGRVHMMIGLMDSELFEFSTTHTEADSVRLFRL